MAEFELQDIKEETIKATWIAAFISSYDTSALIKLLKRYYHSLYEKKKKSQILKLVTICLRRLLKNMIFLHVLPLVWLYLKESTHFPSEYGICICTPSPQFSHLMQLLSTHKLCKVTVVGFCRIILLKDSKNLFRKIQQWDIWRKKYKFPHHNILDNDFWNFNPAHSHFDLIYMFSGCHLVYCTVQREQSRP